MNDSELKDPIIIGKVEGDVTISQGQTGGITANVVGTAGGNGRPFKLSRIAAFATIASAIIAFLTWLNVSPVRDKVAPVLPTLHPVAQKTDKESKAQEGRRMAEDDKNISIGEAKGDVAISINQSGGITANKVTIADPPRLLTQSQREVIIQTLRQFPGQTISVHQLGDGEAGPYGQQITKAILDAGWNVNINWSGMALPPVYGVICQVPDPSRPPVAAKALMTALQKANIPVSLEKGPSSEPVMLYIALKPITQPK
jgi:hypothetical protein